MKKTIEAASAARRPWDAVVVGAGPAGAMAARELAVAGRRLLLIDRQQFPRPKVCGGCLNGRSLGLLESAGLGDLPTALGGEPIDRFALHAAGRRRARAPVEFPMPRGVGVSRTALDAALVEAAVAAGAEFLSGERATLGALGERTRGVELPESGVRLEAPVVLAADGIAGSFLGSASGLRSLAEPDSRIGAGTVLPPGTPGTSMYRRGVVHMAVDRMGYVGLAGVEDGATCVAAALDRHVARDQGLAGAVRRILDRSGLSAEWSAGAGWRGTPPLTRRAHSVALERVFLIGDAAGYIEPFTGEGISWALETARSVTGLAQEAIEEWRPALAPQWRELYRHRIARRQRWCRAIAWGLRRPALVRSVAGLIERAPRVVAPVMSHLNATSTGDTA